VTDDVEKYRDYSNEAERNREEFKVADD